MKKSATFFTAPRLILLLVIAVALGFAIFKISYLSRPGDGVEQTYGVTFSQKQAAELGLDSREAYLAILGDLGVKKVRLSAYWDEIEPFPQEYNWQELDWQLAKAEEYNVEVVLAVGRKLPRWPECFAPRWLSFVPTSQQDDYVVAMVAEVVKRYANNPAVVMWQLENEPFVGWFGTCPEPDLRRLERERAVVRKYSAKPILATDSGELSLWLGSAHFADRFGTTMYRATWNPWFGYSFVVWPPGYYRLKARLNNLEPSEVIVAELQAEPWTPGIPLADTPFEDQMKTMSFQQFTDTITYAKRVGFPEVYLWGAEWWYWMKLHGHPEYWDEARKLF